MSKLDLPSAMLFQWPLPKLGSWVHYNTMRVSFAVRTTVADTRSLGQAQCCLSAAKGDKNKELRCEKKDPTDLKDFVVHSI